MQDSKRVFIREQQLSLFDEVIRQPQQHLSKNDYRVLELLSKGQYTNVEISAILQLPDPRSNIRYLRNADYKICDYWIKSNGTRCKVYFFKNLSND